MVLSLFLSHYRADFWLSLPSLWEKKRRYACHLDSQHSVHLLFPFCLTGAGRDPSAQTPAYLMLAWQFLFQVSPALLGKEGGSALHLADGMTMLCRGPIQPSAPLCGGTLHNYSSPESLMLCPASVCSPSWAGAWTHGRCKPSEPSRLWAGGAQRWWVLALMVIW